MDNERKTVHVSSESVTGYPEPHFVLESNGKIYVTLAVLEFDPANEEMLDDERANLADLQALLDGPRSVTGTTVDEEPRFMTMAQAQSDPH